MRQGRAAPAPSGQGLLLAEPRLHARRAPGGTCLGALAQSFMGRPLPTVESPLNYSKGCGAVMRSAPFGLAARTRSDAFRNARDAAVLTHGHPSGYLSAAYLAALIFDLVRGSSIESGDGSRRRGARSRARGRGAGLCVARRRRSCGTRGASYRGSRRAPGCGLDRRGSAGDRSALRDHRHGVGARRHQRRALACGGARWRQRQHRQHHRQPARARCTASNASLRAGGSSSR